MTLLLDIAPCIEPATPDSTGAEIYQRFQAEPDTLAIAVVDADRRPVGLIERNAFLVRMAGEYGHALWSKRPVTFWMKTDPLVADGDVTVAEFCGRALTERPSELLHGFIVTCGGRYAGVGTTLALLQATATTTAAHAEQMSRLAQDAQEALAARQRFLAVMSHEIRTPLNGVLAVAEIVRRKLRQPELAPFLDTIVDSGGVLLRLLNDALDLSRAEASGLELDEHPMRIAAILEEAAPLWTAQAELKGLTLDLAYEGNTEAWMLADPVRLRQILNNLVGNALKFTERGGVAVRLAAVAEGPVIRLSGSVSDSGPGVPETMWTSIFEPFRQTEEGLRLGGAGLGLAVCRQIIECMDGTIGVGARPGGGAVFSFTAPFYPVAAQTAETGLGTAPETHSPLHVLIADDNATNRLVARSLCEMFGFSCETVEDGAAAVKAAADGRFDLILMDIKMPGMDGVEATRRIRSGAGPASQIPILALTANADAADGAFYRRCGMNGVVEKPIKPDRLLSAMTAILPLEAAEAA